MPMIKRAIIEDQKNIIAAQRALIAELVTALESMMRVADDYEQDIGEKLPAATMDRARAALAKAKEVGGMKRIYQAFWIRVLRFVLDRLNIEMCAPTATADDSEAIAWLGDTNPHRILVLKPKHATYAEVKS